MGPSRNSKQEHNTATHDGGTNMEYIAGVNTYDDDEYTYEYMYVCNVINRKYTVIGTGGECRDTSQKCNFADVNIRAFS